MVDKLVEKGYLSPVEAQIVRDETAQAVATEVAKGESYAVPALGAGHEAERRCPDPLSI